MVRISAAPAAPYYLHADDIDEFGQPLILFRGPGAAALDHVVGVEADPPVEHAGGRRLSGNLLGNARPLGSCKREGKNKKKYVPKQTEKEERVRTKKARKNAEKNQRRHHDRYLFIFKPTSHLCREIKNKTKQKQKKRNSYFASCVWYVVRRRVLPLRRKHSNQNQTWLVNIGEGIVAWHSYGSL